MVLGPLQSCRPFPVLWCIATLKVSSWKGSVHSISILITPDIFPLTFPIRVMGNPQTQTCRFGRQKQNGLETVVPRRSGCSPNRNAAYKTITVLTSDIAKYHKLATFLLLHFHQRQQRFPSNEARGAAERASVRCPAENLLVDGWLLRWHKLELRVWICGKTKEDAAFHLGHLSSPFSAS